MKKLEWLIHSKTNLFNRHVDESRSVIEAALSSDKYIISWSTGKDSTAMTHLVRSVNSDIPIMIQYDDCDWPLKRQYADRVCLSQGWEPHEVMPGFSVWEAIQNYQVGMDDLCSTSCQITKDSFLTPLNKMRDTLGCNGVFLGLRADESRGRRNNFFTRGFVYSLNDGTMRCLPMAKWSALDIFAYLVKHDIEINPYYFMNKFLPPEDIRLSWALPTPHTFCNGFMEHIRYYYPEQFRKLRNRGVI